MDIGRLCLAAAAVQAWHSLGARQDVHFVPRAQACTTGPVLAACGLPLLHKQIRERMRVVGMSAWTQMSSRTHTHARTHTHTPVSQTKINMHTPPSLRSLFPTWRCKERGLCLQCHKCRNHQSPLAQVRKSCMGCGGRVHQIAPARAGTASPHTRRGDSCRRRCCPSTPLR